MKQTLCIFLLILASLACRSEIVTLPGGIRPLDTGKSLFVSTPQSTDKPMPQCIEGTNCP